MWVAGLRWLVSRKKKKPILAAGNVFVTEGGASQLFSRYFHLGNVIKSDFWVGDLTERLAEPCLAAVLYPLKSAASIEELSLYYVFYIMYNTQWLVNSSDNDYL